MKPNPRLLLEAMEFVGIARDGCIFIGDAVRDIQAGHAAGIRTIGYANKPGKYAKLARAGAVAVVDSMQIVADAMA